MPHRQDESPSDSEDEVITFPPAASVNGVVETNGVVEKEKKPLPEAEIGMTCDLKNLYSGKEDKVSTVFL
jgi:hypothetical protein